MKEEALVDGYSIGLVMVGIKSSNERIEFSASKGFGSLLTNPRKTDNGQTIGERNRVLLHRRLDAWLDGTWQENKDD
jgi:hypothetical protein